MKLWFQVADYVFRILLIAGLVFAISYTASVAQESRETAVESHESLCAFKSDLQERHANSVRYLAMTPQERVEEFGPQLGSIPEQTIKTSKRNQEQTLSALSNLNCKED